MSFKLKKDMEEARNTRITPKFLDSALAAKAADMGWNDAFGIPNKPLNLNKK